MNRFLQSAAALAALSLTFVACNRDDEDDDLPTPGTTVNLTSFATSQVLWTGVAVTRENAVFACYPRMDTDTIPYSVARVSETSATPFPNADWNAWAPGLNPADHFVCAQSVYVDDQNFLWVLDPASPQMRGVVKGGAKLLKFDPNSGQLLQRIVFDETVAFPSSYLNDVRVDTQKQFAYITDSNQGAIVVVNLATGRARRLLGNSRTTKSENLIVTVEGRVWRNASGKLPSIDADGIALSPNRDYVYFHALTARGLYRIGTQYLQNESLTDAQVAQQVQYLGDTEPVDGMVFGRDSSLYLTYIQRNAVARITPQGQLQGVVSDSLLKWPDSFALAPDGGLYVTSSQLHIPRSQRTQPFRLFKVSFVQQ